MTPLANAPSDPGEYCIYNVNASSFGYNPNTMGSDVLVYDPDLGIAQYEATAPSPGGDLAGAQLQAHSAAAVPITSLDESEVGAVTYKTMVTLAMAVHGGTKLPELIILMRTLP